VLWQTVPNTGAGDWECSIANGGLTDNVREDTRSFVLRERMHRFAITGEEKLSGGGESNWLTW